MHCPCRSMKDKGEYERCWYLKDDHMVKAIWKENNTFSHCQCNGHVTRFCTVRARDSRQKANTKKRHSEETAVAVMKTGAVSRVSPIRPAAFTGTRLLQQRDGRGWLFSCSSTSCRAKCWRSRRTWTRIQSSVTQKSVNRHGP